MIDYKMRNPWILTFKTIAEDMLEKEAVRRRTNRWTDSHGIAAVQQMILIRIFIHRLSI